MSRCTIVDQDLVPKLLEIISLVLESESSKSKPFHDEYTYKSSSSEKPPTFGKRCSSLVNECLLTHRFKEAAKLLWVMCQERCGFDLFFYKGTMIVLENLMPNNDEMVKKISRAAQHLNYLNKWDALLDYLIYVFKSNIDDLQNSPEMLNKKVRGLKPIPLLHNIYTAYCALVNYLKWIEITQSDTLSTNGKDLALNVINNFKKVIDQPGIWDIFVLKLIEMLEFYEEYDDLEEILKKYVECNPEHLNAYIYLCIHLYKHKTDSEEFIHYAKILNDFCPSDERVFLLVQTWEKMGIKFKKRLKILFYFLDYPANKRNILGWEMMSSHLHEAVFGKQSESLDIVKSLWNLRCYSWNHVHFCLSDIYSENETFKLLLCKVKVLTILESNHKFIQKAEMRFPDINKLKLRNDGIAIPDSEEFKSVYHYHLDR